MIYRFYGKGKVWDKQNKRFLCDFGDEKKIELDEKDNDDKYIIDTLIKGGYKYERLMIEGEEEIKVQENMQIETEPEKEPNELDTMEHHELVQMCKDRGLQHRKSMREETLRDIIKKGN